jgi:rod shape determining protein RodA
MKIILRWLLDLLARFMRSLDPWLLAGLLVLMVIGLANQYSASNDSVRMVTNQGVYFCIGLGGLWVASRMPVHILKQLTPIAYVLSLVPLVLVLFIGKGKYGDHWINLGLFNYQPSETAKLTLPMMLAWTLDRQRLPLRLRGLPAALLVIALPVGLVLRQHDLGTSVLVLSSGLIVLYLAGLSWGWFIGGGVVGTGGFALAMLAPMTWFPFLRPYQQDRILTFRNPDNDPMGAGWNILQSKIAIGAGGLTGRGWGQGTQSHLNYLPEHTTDFIFSVLSEEFGWIGVITVLALYLFVIGRCLWIAAQSRDGYGRLLAGSLGMSLFVYVLVNGGMVAGVLPVVGVPMPLLSYGGTAPVTLLMGFGVVMAIKGRRQIHR